MLFYDALFFNQFFLMFDVMMLCHACSLQISDCEYQSLVFITEIVQYIIVDYSSLHI